MKKIIFLTVVIIFSLYACVSQKKYKAQISQFEEQKEQINELAHEYASKNESLKLELNSSIEQQRMLEEKYKEALKAETAVPIESKTDEYKDTDGDQVPDIYDKCPQISGTINNNGCPESKVENIQHTTSVVQKTDKLADINIGRALQNFVIIPQCPDSVEIHDHTFIQIMLDFTGKEDSIDIDIRTVASNYSDIANIKTIKKRILKTDLGFIAEYMKIEMNYIETPLLIKPEPGSNEYVKVSSLLNSKKVYKWIVSCDTPGKYAYSVNVVWYNNDKSFIKSIPITTCPGEIIAYEKPKPIIYKAKEVIEANIWTGISGAIGFLLAFAGKWAWSKITTA